MKGISSWIPAVVAACLIAGCSSITFDYDPSPLGDDIDAFTQSGHLLRGEFLSMDDTAVYLISRATSTILHPPLTEGELVCVPLRTLESVSVNGYSDRSWLLPIAVFQVLPAVLIGIAADRWDGSGAAHFSGWMIPAVVTGLLFEVSTPRVPRAAWPFPLNETEALRKYARYPRGLPAGAMEALLARQNQRAMRTIP